MSTFTYENFGLQTGYWGFNSNHQSPANLERDHQVESQTNLLNEKNINFPSLDRFL